MKRKMLALALAAIMVVPSISGCGGSSDSGSAATGSKTEDSASTESSGDDGEITLTIWDWDEAHLTHMTEWYHEKHPNINFDTLVVSTADYMQKLQSALASGSGVPDIILSEMAYRGKVWDLGITEDLSKDPYNVKKEDMFDFATDLGSGPNGELYGVEQQICPSGFAYRRDLAKEYLGKKVASDITSMKDGAASAAEVSSYLFDDEGTLGTDTTIIENGTLVTGISDLLSALRLGTAPTGNGKRESFERKAYTRMTNTFFTAGENTLDEMIASIKEGYLLEGAQSGMEDPKHWGIQCMVSMGREIKDGKLTGKVVGPLTLTGYVPDLLKSITMRSEKVELFGTGACGKGYKEWVKVSDGGPYLKCKVRLG